MTLFNAKKYLKYSYGIFTISITKVYSYKIMTEKKYERQADYMDDFLKTKQTLVILSQSTNLKFHKASNLNYIASKIT